MNPVWDPFRLKKKSSAKAKKKAVSKKTEESFKLVPEYHLLRDLENTSCERKFGKRLGEDAERTKKNLSQILSKTRPSRKANLSQEEGEVVDASPRVLRIIQGGVHGLDTWALLDTGAVPDILSLSFAQKLSMRFTKITKGITVTNGQICSTVGIVQDLPIPLQDKKLSPKFLVVKYSPLDVIVGTTTIESRLRDFRDYLQLLVKSIIDDSKIELLIRK